MEVQSRRLRTVHIQEQENIHVIRGKVNNVPVKKQGLAVRGALGDLNTNAQVQRDINVGKVAIAAAEIENKTNACRPAKSYSHVQSKVDTGRAFKTIQPSSRPPLRREESTAGLAAKATSRSWTLKDTSRLPDKENMSLNIPSKKGEIKKPAKLTSIRENRVPSNKSLKPILKEPTESLQKLKIEEKSSIIDLEKLNNHPSLIKDIKPNFNLDNSLVIPDHIEDIDADDSNTVTLITTYVKDIYRYLLELEDVFPIQPDYINKNEMEITPKMRAMLIDWLVEVHIEFMQQQETLHLTVSIIDRYLQATPQVSRKQLQLVGVSAMFLAAKYEEVYPPDISDFVYVAASTYTKKEILMCEREIFMKLNHCLAKPVPLWFLRRFVKAARGNTKKHSLSKYFVDLCLVDYSMVHYKPSELAAAAVCLSLHVTSGESLEEVWTSTMEFYSGYKLDYLLPIIKKIAGIVANVGKEKNGKAVYNKYSHVRHSKVATLPELRSEALYKLADSPTKC